MVAAVAAVAVVVAAAAMVRVDAVATEAVAAAVGLTSPLSVTLLEQAVPTLAMAMVTAGCLATTQTATCSGRALAWLRRQSGGSWTRGRTLPV